MKVTDDVRTFDVYEPCECYQCRSGATDLRWWSCLRIGTGERKPIASYKVHVPAASAFGLALAAVQAMHPGKDVVVWRG